MTIKSRYGYLTVWTKYSLFPLLLSMVTLDQPKYEDGRYHGVGNT